MHLSDIACKKAKPGLKPQKIFDGDGMYLEVMPSGSKYWRLKYRYGAKEKRLALGVYPEVTRNKNCKAFFMSYSYKIIIYGGRYG